MSRQWSLITWRVEFHLRNSITGMSRRPWVFHWHLSCQSAYGLGSWFCYSIIFVFHSEHVVLFFVFISQIFKPWSAKEMFDALQRSALIQVLLWAPLFLFISVWKWINSPLQFKIQINFKPGATVLFTLSLPMVVPTISLVFW